jgi:hypothetical protein
MKRRIRKIANFFAFNLLFFALYLNFIHKDKITNIADPGAQHNAAAFSGTVLVENPSEYLNSASEVAGQTVATQQPTTEPANVALKLSIN